MFFQVTLTQGRTDTVTVEADSLTDVKTFFESVTTANITMIKKIVYSKELGIGSAITTYNPNNHDRYLKILVENESNEVASINIQFPIKNLTKDKIVTSVKKNLMLNKKPITKVINILRSEIK